MPLLKLTVCFFYDDELDYSTDQPSGLAVGRNLLGALERANRQQWLDFASWYSRRNQRLAGQLAKDRPRLIGGSLDRAARLVKIGLLPKTAPAKMQKAYDWAGEFQPIGSVEQAANNHVAYCDRQGIGMSNLYSLPYNHYGINWAMRRVVFHEGVHAVGHLNDERYGLFFGLTSRQYNTYNRWLEEAFTAAVSDAAMADDAPPCPSDAPPSYPKEREFLDILKLAAPQPLEDADLAAAHFSQRSRRTSARQYVAAAITVSLNELFPEYRGWAFERINQEYERQHCRAQREAYIGSQAVLAATRL